MQPYSVDFKMFKINIKMYDVCKPVLYVFKARIFANMGKNRTPIKFK